MQNFTDNDFFLTGSSAPEVNKRGNTQVILGYLHGYIFKNQFLIVLPGICVVETGNMNRRISPVTG